MKKVVLAIFALWSFVQAHAEFLLESGDAKLAISTDGKSVVMACGNDRYESLNAPSPITLEVNGETLCGSYDSVKSTASGGIECRGVAKSRNGSLFDVVDTYATELPGHFSVTREINVAYAAPGDDYFNSYFGFTLDRKVGVSDFEFFVPGIWYRDNTSLHPGFLAGDYTDNYFYFREDRLPLPVVSAMSRNGGMAIDMVHVDAVPESFYGEDGVNRIVDERMQFGSLGFAETGVHSIVFAFPGIEGEKPLRKPALFPLAVCLLLELPQYAAFDIFRHTSVIRGDSRIVAVFKKITGKEVKITFRMPVIVTLRHLECPAVE